MNKLKTRIVLNWRISAIFMGTKDKTEADQAFLIRGGPNAETFLSGLRKR